MLKAERKKKPLYIKETPIKLTGDSLTETLKTRRFGTIYSKYWKENTWNQKCSIHQGSDSNLKEQ